MALRIQLLGLDRQGTFRDLWKMRPTPLHPLGDRLEDPAHHAMTAADLLRGCIKSFFVGTAKTRRLDYITVCRALSIPSGRWGGRRHTFDKDTQASRMTQNKNRLEMRH
ncbi:hypothetical protein CDAR_14881 [Caerostris darwini]|uniref:Uncharacterized protein n=1 Tax=Caerostris darwini TaxID=1538125 RepID=A0AAV4W929_9ARAC|nr:hypothetical protein CDAR_14881 [Caerostris darwini]